MSAEMHNNKLFDNRNLFWLFILSVFNRCKKRNKLILSKIYNCTLMHID